MRCSVIRIITKLSRLFPHYLVYFRINCNFIIREFLTFVAIVIVRYLHSKLRFLFLASFLEEVSYRKLSINGNQTNIGKISQRKLD